MNFESIKSSHIKEVMTKPNPMVMEATKLYLSNKRLDTEAYGANFLETYLKMEIQMYNVLNNIIQREASIPKTDILPEETIAIASESPKFKI